MISDWRPLVMFFWIRVLHQECDDERENSPVFYPDYPGLFAVSRGMINDEFICPCSA
jgi:hypothetical protein